MKKYGLAEPPHVAIENYSIPTALISGDVDTLAVPADVQWIKEQLGDNVVFAQEYHLNHGGFVMAVDMDFFSVDVVNLLEKYNPTSTEAMIHAFLN